MFARCDRDTMTIIDAAFDEARRLGHHLSGNRAPAARLAQRPGLLPVPVASLLPGARGSGRRSSPPAAVPPKVTPSC